MRILPTSRRPLALALVALLSGSVAACSRGADGPAASTVRTPPERRAPLSFEGPVGGPFGPGSQRLALRPDGGAALRWTARASAPWFEVTPAQGEWSPGAALELEVRVGSAASELAPGCHWGAIEWSPQGGAAQSLAPVCLVIAQDGWTTLAPSPDSRLVYVSSSEGSDAKDGASPSTPKRTLAAGIAQLRSGHPDWLLLKRGDTWTEALGHWTRSGSSAAAPMVVTSYGDGGDRPVLLTGTGHGLITMGPGNPPPGVDHLALVGLHMRAHEYVGGEDGPTALTWLVPTQGVLIEDCRFENFRVGITFDGAPRKRSVRIRRNVIVGCFATQGTIGHGLYLACCDGLTLEENLIDHNGWNPAVPGAVPSIFRHGVYIQNREGACTDVLLRGNIVSNSASHGVQMRSGGVALDNLFVRNSIALLLGGAVADENAAVWAIASRNVVLDGKDIDEQNPRGWGIACENLSAALLGDNVVAHNRLGSFPMPFALEGAAAGFGVRDVAMSGNVVHDWGGPTRISGGPPRIGPLWLERNRFEAHSPQHPLLHVVDAEALVQIHASDNRYRSAAPAGQWFDVGGKRLSLADWTRRASERDGRAEEGDVRSTASSVESYMASLNAPATLEAFVSGARAQSRTSWDPRYTAAAVNAHVRAAFGMR